MTRATGLVLTLALLLSANTAATAHSTPEAYQVVERFAAALSAGDILEARSMLGDSVTWSEYDLYWRVAPTRLDVARRVAELVHDGTLLETELVAIVGVGEMVITHERMWSDVVPEALAPLRSTTVYLVEAGRIVGITRVLVTEQRDALLTATSVGVWRYGSFFVQHDADGTYRTYACQSNLLAEVHADSGTYTVAGGVFTYVSDDDSLICEAGDRSPFRLQMSDDDTVHADPLREQIECLRHRFSARPGRYSRVVEW